MKKFFRYSCVNNAGGLSAFILIAFYLFLIWQLIMSGSLFAQLLAVVIVLYFMITAVIGEVIILHDVIRKIIAKKKKTAPTEVSAACSESSSFGDDFNDGQE